MATIRYVQGASLPDATFAWYDRGNLIDFSADFAFEVRVGQPGQTAEFVKATGITGSDTVPNVAVAWDDTDLGVLDPGFYQADLEAINDADDRSYKLRFTVEIQPAVD